jgi:hypothetical protein
MLADLQAWQDRLMQMSPAKDPISGALNLANFCGDMIDNVQASGGHTGIFKFNRPLFTATLAASFAPTASPSVWATEISVAWQAAVSASIITPGTVTNPAWLISFVDVNTLPIGASTIITLSIATNTLKNALVTSQSTFTNSVPDGSKAFAKAFRDATLMFKFLCIGIAGTPVSPVPLPLPLGAQ